MERRGMSDTTTRANSGPSNLRYICTSGVLRRNILLALIVGCLLTLTNQLDVLLSQPFTVRLGLKILFNFVTPFAVSSTSAAVNRPR